MVAGKALKAAKTAAKAGKGAESVYRLDATTILWLIVSMIGLLAIVALIVIVIIIGLAGSSTSTSYPSPLSSTGALPEGMREMIDMSGGDGTGTFAEKKVPKPDLASLIKNAAGKCDLITPVIIAAQIDFASGFDATKEGGAGRRGLSQLTPEVFAKYGSDSDKNGKKTVLDAADDIHTHARYFCRLADEVQKLLDAKTVVGDQLTLTFMAWELGLEFVKSYGGMPLPDQSTYPFRVRQLFAKYTTGASTTPRTSATPKTQKKVKTTPGLTEERFENIFPNRATLYSYAGLADAMAKFPAFAGTGNEQARSRELAAFLGNIDHETGGLVYTEELDKAAWGNYCDPGQAYGCPAGRTAYHGRGPIQLSWNYNYKAAGDALGIDLLSDPDLVKTDSSVAWQTALWFWMTRTSAGSTTAHDAITRGGGFGATIRVINGIECDGKNPAKVSSRITAYRRIAAILGTEPGDDNTLTC